MAVNLQIDASVNAQAQPVKDQQGKPSALTVSTDNVGIGTATPKAKLHVTADIVAGSDVNGQKFIFYTRTDGGGDFLHITGDDATGTWEFNKGIIFHRATGHVAIGTYTTKGLLNVGGDYYGKGHLILHAYEGDGQNGTAYVQARDDSSTSQIALRLRTKNGSSLTDAIHITPTGNVGIGTTAPTEKLEVNGTIVATGDIRLTNADCAEDFPIGIDRDIEPGTVMVVGEEGALFPSQQAYDKCVAGVISGAGDYKPGIVLDTQAGATNRQPIALVGKVYCKVDAQYGAIAVGDLLTTSPTLGHAMKAANPLKAIGAMLGKALRPLAAGQGLIPILIALQ